MTLVLIVVLVALIFEYINGFHDTANSIATVVSTKVLTPRMAIGLAAFTNLFGALVGVAVAKTISSGLVDSNYVTSATIVCALLGGIIWNLITWWLGLPSSSTHALVGGLVGATLATAASMLPADTSAWSAIIWEQTKTGAPLKDQGGLLYKVIIPMIVSPLMGFLVGYLVMTVLYVLLLRARPAMVTQVFGKAQVASAAFMGFSHGQADAQKTMGIIALALVGATNAGVLNGLPDFLGFLRVESLGPKNESIPAWIKVTCALTMCLGTAAGGWKIIKTMGHKMVKLQPVHGFAAETTAATVLVTAASFGMPVSTTHAITTSIMGVGCAKRWNALNLPVITRIIIAWVLTLPVTAMLGWGAMKLWLALGVQLK
jgi:inorganic phosphate transporter, PiT family